MRSAHEQEPKLSSNLALRRRTLWLGEMELYGDHLSITGWRWPSTVHRPIRLTDIQQVEKWIVPHGVNFVIRPEEDRDVYCRVGDHVFFWVKELREDERTDAEIQP